MQLSKNAVEDFKKLYFKKYKIKLSDEEANKKGLLLLHVFKAVYKPVPNK